MDAKKQLDKVQCQQQPLAESAVKESAVYKTLQSQFTIAAVEGTQLRACLEETKSLLASARQLHFSQLEEIRSVQSAVVWDGVCVPLRLYGQSCHFSEFNFKFSIFRGKNFFPFFCFLTHLFTKYQLNTPEFKFCTCMWFA